MVLQLPLRKTNNEQINHELNWQYPLAFANLSLSIRTKATTSKALLVVHKLCRFGSKIAFPRCPIMSRTMSINWNC